MGLLIAACFLSSPPAWAITPEDEDRAFIDFLVKELHYYDTALRYIDSLLKRGNLQPRFEADLFLQKIDCLKNLGKTSEANALATQFKQRFPQHARASLGNLEKIGEALGRVIEVYDQAVLQPDKKKAAALRAEGASLFLAEVEKPLDALIADLRKKAEPPRAAEDKAKKKPRGAPSEAEQNLLRSRNQVELARVKIFLVYARKVPLDDPARKARLEKGLALADEFVNKRFEFPVMQYEGQLQKGLYQFELGLFNDAEESLGVLYSIEPAGEKPYPKPVVAAFKTLRLQAILFAGKAMNAFKNYQRAVQIIEQNYAKARKDEFDLTKSEDDPDLRKFAVLVRLEYGIALAGSGQAQAGLGQIRDIITKYKASGAGGAAQAFVTDARKALGRIAITGAATLQGKDYYEAAIGLKSELKLEDAVLAFQMALSRLNPRNAAEMNATAPRCLNEIGEINYLLGRFGESAVAYEEACRYFPQAEGDLLAKVAQNFLAASTRAIKATEGGLTHSGLVKLKEEAAKFSDQHGGGVGIAETMRFDARYLEDEGKYDAARKKYLEIPAKVKDQQVPFYLWAQAKAAECLYRQWDQAEPEGKKPLEKGLLQAIKELKSIVTKALKEKNKPALAAAALPLGQIHYQREEWPQAVKTLRVFAVELAGEPLYKCMGLGSLILSELRAEERDQAAAHYQTLEGECKDDPIVASSASAIADAYEAAGDAVNAARFILEYARHPASKADVEKPETLLRIARMAIEGNDIKSAEQFLLKTKKIGKDDPSVERTVMYFEGKVLLSRKKLNEVIAKLEAYVKKYNASAGENYEDPYVLKDLAEAYLSRGEAPGAKQGPPLKDIETGESNYNAACGILLQRKNATKDPDPALEKAFWTWALRLFSIKMKLGDRGATNEYREIMSFVESNQKSGMGGRLEEFMKLAEEAKDKLYKATSKGAGK